MFATESGRFELVSVPWRGRGVVDNALSVVLPSRAPRPDDCPHWVELCRTMAIRMYTLLRRVRVGESVAMRENVDQRDARQDDAAAPISTATR